MDIKFAESDLKRNRIVPDILDLAITGLVNMYDPAKGFFCYRRCEANEGNFINVGVSRRYTIISLMGLYRYEECIGRSSIDIIDVIERFVQEFGNNDNVGDLGLLIWLCALAYPKGLEKLYGNYLKDHVLERFDDFRQAKTMELSWLLTGLSIAKERHGTMLRNHDELAKKIHGLILSNYGGKGIFYHVGKTGISGRLRGKIGSFADQVYPSYALSVFSNAYKIKDSIVPAIETMKTICRLQGEQGQWWWHYDAKSGELLGRYPVYSVHQYGMAPMTLFEVGGRAGLDFSHFINLGLGWIAGNNEVGESLINREHFMIWRSISQNKILRYQEELSALITKREGISRNRVGSVKVLRESRPYCFGWLLYSFVGKY